MWYVGISLEVFWGRILFPILKHMEHPVIALASSHYITKAHCKLISIFFSAFYCFFEPSLPSEINLVSVLPELCFPLSTFIGVLKKNTVFILFCFSEYKKTVYGLPDYNGKKLLTLDSIVSCLKNT